MKLTIAALVAGLSVAAMAEVEHHKLALTPPWGGTVSCVTPESAIPIEAAESRGNPKSGFARQAKRC